MREAHCLQIQLPQKTKNTPKRSKSTFSSWSSISQTLNHSVKVPVSLTWSEMAQKLTYLLKMHSHTWNAAAWSQQFNLHESQTGLSVAGWVNYFWFLINLIIFAKFDLNSVCPKKTPNPTERNFQETIWGNLKEAYKSQILYCEMTLLTKI